MPRRPHRPTGRPPQPPPPGEPGPKQVTVELGLRCLELLGQNVDRSVLAERLHVTRKRVDYALKVVRKMGHTVPEPAPKPDKPRRRHRAVHQRALEVPGEYRWQDDAVCFGEPLELFFGPENERAAERFKREKEAKTVCKGCPVRTECLDWSIGGTIPSGRWNQAGTWGGMGEEERAGERRKRMRAASERRAEEVRVA